jgi:hypothetical protein
VEVIEAALGLDEKVEVFVWKVGREWTDMYQMLMPRFKG